MTPGAYMCPIIVRQYRGRPTLNFFSPSFFLLAMPPTPQDALDRDLKLVQGHLRIRPRLERGNLAAMVSWHAIGALFQVSQLQAHSYIRLLTCTFQGNIRKWEQADPTWEVPEYVQLFDQDLAVAQAWIATGGTAMTLGPVDPQPASDGKSEADESEEELMP